MWTTELQQRAVETINRLCRCPDLAAVALVLTWWAWRRTPDAPVESVAWYCALHARQGRDLPGIGATRRLDALRHCSQGGGMDGVIDPGPGPDELVADAEAYPVWYDSLTDREREAADLYTEGRRNMDVAADLHISQGRAGQLRRQMAEKWKEIG
jgi:hypothetical protein